jgi:hypothetical protein
MGGGEEFVGAQAMKPEFARFALGCLVRALVVALPLTLLFAGIGFVVGWVEYPAAVDDLVGILAARIPFFIGLFGLLTLAGWLFLLARQPDKPDKPK